MKKKKFRFKKNFIIISAVFIIGLMFAYGSRLVHFYLKENKKIDDSGSGITNNYFTEILENTINVSDINGGLYLDGDNAYMYKYAAEENYLWYSGQLWRLIRINEDKTISMITDEAISLIHPNFEDEIYINDYLKEFYDSLNKKYLVEFSYCDDQIDDLKKTTCSNSQKGTITLLDMETYKKTGNTKSFINNKTTFWLNNTNTENNYWYIDEVGAVGLGTENVAHNVRPVVTLKKEIKLISGDGTLDNPYIIEDQNKSKISDSSIGEYIKYNDELWRILNISTKSVSAIKVECIKESDECLNYKFGYDINYLNSSIYKYLNETYLIKLENNDFLVKDIFYTGTYNNYNFKTIKENNIEAYIGIPKIAEYYIQNNINSYLITPNVIETVYTLNESGNYYLVKPTTEKNIYPIINFDINLLVTNGNGTINNPYELSR